MLVWGKYLPLFSDPCNAASTICVTALKELDTALTHLDSARGAFNPLQRQLIDRLTNTCEVFGREMLSANSERMMLRLSENKSPAHVDIRGGRPLIDDICSDAFNILEDATLTVRGAIIGGFVDVITSARTQIESAEWEAVDAILSSMSHLVHQVAVLFEVQACVLRRHQLFYKTDVKVVSDGAETACQLSVEEFMQTVKPRVRRPTRRERLSPYIAQLMKLRESGYSYAQCAQFLHENGIKIKPVEIGSALREDVPTRISSLG